MTYSLSDLIWLFFIYSFVGWCIEVCYAAVRRRQFVNRGFVSSPLCPFEYVCSVFTEAVFGTIFWDYSGFAFNLGGRIEKIPKRFGTVFFNCLIVFMLMNMIISSLALARYTERHTSEPPTTAETETSALADFLDRHFDDERMERIYPNAKLVD